MPGPEYDYLFKITLIGDEKTGKSSIITRYAEELFSGEYQRTMGVDFKIKDVPVGGQTIKLQIWDTSGNKRFSDLTKSYLRSAHSILICCDLTQPECLANIKDWVGKAKEKENTNKPVLFLVGTHSDEKDKIQITPAQLQAQAKELGCEDSFIVSAKTGENVENTFTSVATSILNKYAPQKQSTLQEKPTTSPRISRETLHQTYCKHITGPRIFSNTRSNIFGFFNGNDRPVNEIIEDLKVRAGDHDGASRKTCDELKIAYNSRKI